jgi:hypothetical protein
MDVKWSERSVEDMAALDKAIARRVKKPSSTSTTPALAASRACKAAIRLSSDRVSVTGASASSRTPARFAFCACSIVAKVYR